MKVLRPAVSLLALAAVTIGAAPPQTNPLPSGRMVDLGGYRVHISCLGRGRPTVMLLHGLGDYSFDWTLVESALANRTRVCAYDRPGQAWSNPGPPPRGLETSSRELRKLISKSGLRGPIVLVGHSWGGMIARVYAYEHPSEVAGMVLVDSTDEDDYLWINGKVVRPLHMSQTEWSELTKPHEGRSAPPSGPPHASSAAAEQPMPPLEAPYNRLPVAVQNVRRWAMSLALDGRAFRGGDTSDFRRDFAFMNRLDSARPHPLDCMPLIVLAKTPGRDDDTDYSAEQLRWNAGLQRKLAALSKDGELIVAGASGHHIQLDEPDLVVRAIETVILRAQSSR